MNKKRPVKNQYKTKKLVNNTNTWIYGIHAVKSALSSGRKPHKILVNHKIKHKSDIKFSKLLEPYQNITEYIEYTDFNKYLSEELTHQGIAILITTPKLLELQDFITDLKNNNNNHEINRVAILDRITDVGNIGAIIRSAVAFGIKYIFIPEHHSFFDYGILSKASSGMIEEVKIIQISNITNLLNTLKKNGFWCIGFSLKTKQNLSHLPKTEKLAIILGNEHKGIRPLIEKNCDLLISIAMDKKAESLNVSNTAAIVFHELFRN